MNIKKIAITGTKGKTTTAYLIAALLQRLDHQVLRVDSTGHFVDGVRKSSVQDSLDTWGLVPTVAPGRFLYEFATKSQKQEEQTKQSVAVLECSLGCSTISGMGYKTHDVGVFLNVYEDHLGSTKRLQTKQDIVKAKSFIFQRLAHTGWAVCNADDPLVMQACEDFMQADTHLEYSVLPFGIGLEQSAIEKHLIQGGGVVTLQGTAVVYKTQTRVQEIIDTKELPWTFGGTFKPSLYNLMAAVAAVIAYNKGRVPARLAEEVARLRLDPNEGRLVLFESHNGAKILADYAHEKISLAEVARLGRTLAAPQGKVIGVVRLAYDRTDELIIETGQHIASLFDHVVVYDKIDGHFRQPKENLRNAQFKKQVVGRVSGLLAGAIQEKNPHCEQIIREDHAAQRAAAIAQPGDVVVYIVNDDITRSNGFIKEYFKAVLV